MKILIIARAFYPDITPRSFRATELVKEFSKRGHEVTLATTFRPKFHQSFCNEYGVKMVDLGRSRLPKIGTSSNKLLNMPMRIINRLLFQLFEYPAIEWMFKVRRVLVSMQGFDLTISIANPHPIHWGTALVRGPRSKLTKVWVGDCGDPYMFNRADSFRKPFYFSSFEKLWCRRADFISITRMDMKSNYYPEFADKIVEITQGFNFNEASKFLSPYVKNKVPTFAYAGNFIAGIRDPRPFLRFLLAKETDFKFHVFTKTKSIVEGLLSKNEDRVIINDTVPRDQLLGLLSMMDFVVNIGFSPTLQVPSKLIDYHLCGRPILSFEWNAIKEDVVNEFLQGDYSNKFEELDFEKFRIESVCDQFESLTH